MAEDNATGSQLGEKTRAQVISSFGRELTNPLPASYDTYRTMRKHPTLALGRALIAAPVLAGSWSVEADDDVPDAETKKAFILDQFTPWRSKLMERGIFDTTDFGASPFETVFGRAGGKTVIDKFKHLLVDLTTILIDENTGAFWGYQQLGSDGSMIELEARYILHIAFRVEGTQWWGTSLLENARETYNQWQEANLGAERYDAKIAGSHWVVYYPVGTTSVDGTETDNASIAEDVLDAVESAGSLAIPTTVAAFVKEMSNTDPAWRVEMIEDKGGRQPTFIDRLSYLDKLLVRSLLVPERAILEGEFGTKAEAGVHAGLAILMVTLWDQGITKAVNEQPVDELLEQNWGPGMRGKVRLVSAPLTDAELAFLREIYKAVLANPQALLEELPNIDLKSLKERLGIPEVKEEEEGELDNLDDALQAAGRGALKGDAPLAGIDLAQRYKLVDRPVEFGTVGKE